MRLLRGGARVLLLVKFGAPLTSMILPVQTGEPPLPLLKHPRPAPVSKILWSLFFVIVTAQEHVNSQAHTTQ